jgi:hypothetical protein
MVMGAGSVPVCSAPERLAPLWRRAVARTHREGMAHTAAYHEGPSVALRLVTAAWGMFGMRAYVRSDINTFMSRAILCRLERE